MRHSEEPRRDIIAIGASAGGVEAISALLAELPRDLPATVLVVLHRPLGRPSYMPEILAHRTRLRVAVPHEGEPLRHGMCLIAPPDRHLTIGEDLRVHLALDHYYRGANIDALFQSLADNAGQRTIGVVLSGTLKDGTAGLRRIKQKGGVALVQSPSEATFSGMPLSAIHHDGLIDFVGPTSSLAVEISKLTGHARPPDAVPDCPSTPPEADMGATALDPTTPRSV